MCTFIKKMMLIIKKIIIKIPLLRRKYSRSVTSVQWSIPPC